MSIFPEAAPQNIIVSYKLTGLIGYQIPSGTVPLLGDVQLIDFDNDANRDTQHRR